MVKAASRDVIIALKLAADPHNQIIADKVTRQAEIVSVAGVSVADSVASDYKRIEVGRTQNYIDESKERIRNDLEEVDQRITLQDELTDKLRDAEEKRTESKQKAIEATSVAIQGLADMTEGAAKLGLVSEENFEKFAKNFDMIQEGIRIFKGFTDVIWKGREALVAMSAATHAQASANNLLATSGAIAGTGAVAARGGRNVLGKVAVGAGGVALGYGGKAVAQGTGVMASAKAAGASAVHGAKVFGVLAGQLALAAVAGIALLEIISATRRAFGDTSASAEGFTNSLREWWNASSKAEEGTNNLTESEVKRQKRQAESSQFAAQEAARSRLNAELRQRQNTIAGHRAFLDGETPAQAAERERQAALRDVSAAQSNMDRTLRTDKERGAAGLFVSEENRIRVAKTLEEAQMRLLDAEKQRLSLVRDQNERLKDQLKIEQDRLKTVVEAGKSEKEKMIRAFAELSPVIQSQVRKIAAKVKAGGEINERDNRILKRARLDGKLTQQFDLKKGLAAGGEQALDALTLFDDIKKTNHDQLMKAGKTSGQLHAGQSHETDIVAQFKGLPELLKKQTEARIRFEAEFLKISEENIKGLTQPILKAQQAGSAMVQKAAADASDAITASAMQNVDALKSLLETVEQGFDNIKGTVEQSELLKGAYQQ